MLIAANLERETLTDLVDQLGEVVGGKDYVDPTLPLYLRPETSYKTKTPPQLYDEWVRCKE